MASNLSSSTYPVLGMIPKRETGAYEFLRKYPNYDGRGIKMCIMDSGVDPGAAGLEVTTTGAPKIVDICDASGAGDIDTSAVAEVDSEGFLSGHTGRKLKVPAEWNSHDNKFHMGVVKLFSVVSEDHHDAWKKHRKLTHWMPRHAEATASIMSRVLATQDVTVKEDLEAEQDALKVLEEKYEDLGPVFDIVVFFDGTLWWAALDISESGDLAAATPLTNYRDQYKYATIGGIYQLNYTVNILEDGNRVEFVVPQEHGTHVASIAAACFPDEPERNGMAPGCQIVSIKIGHTLLDGSNETGTSLVRAFLYCMKNGVDIVNISYNEPYNWSNGGRVFEAIEMAVRQYGMIVCVAAGNAGPGLSTVGSLPASPYTLGIGACVTPDMMKDMYGMTHNNPALMYNWTSRGPTLEGALGVAICAPGGAVASMPTYALKNCSLFNGTSMASPNACGTIALVLSGLRWRQLKWSAFHVRRAVENTAKNVDSSADARLSQGFGMIHCQDAFNWLVTYGQEPERDVDIQVSVEGGRGIYIRNLAHLNDCLFTVGIDSTFPQNKPELYPEMPKFCLNATVRASENWIIPAEFVSITTGKKAFKVQLRTSGLRPGLHTASIFGYDSKNTEKGPVFTVPVTVCVPELKSRDEWTVQNSGVVFRPGEPGRQFLPVPQGASWAEWRLELVDYQGHKSLPVDANPILNFEYHATQLAQNAQYKAHMFREAAAIPIKRVISVTFPVSDRLGLLELAVALFWNRISSAVVNWTLDFHGLKPTVPEIVYQEGEAYYRVDVDAGGRSEYLQPSVVLTHLIQPLRPTDFVVSPLTQRDSWPDGRLTFQMILQYQFNLSKGATVEATCPLLLDFLYENEIEGQMYKLYDSNKRLMRCGEARVMRKIDFTAKLGKGDFFIQLQLRHDNRKILEKLQDVIIHLRRKLPAPGLSFDIVPTYLAALRGAEEKFKPSILAPRQSQFFFLMPPASDKLGKGIHGSYYVDGWMYFSLGRDQPPDTRRNAGAIKLKYVLTEPARTKAATKQPAKDLKDNVDDPLFLHQLGFFEKASDLKIRAELYRSFLADTKGVMQQLKLNHAYLLSLGKSYENKKPTDQEQLNELLKSITDTSDAIIAAVDQKELLAGIGSQPDSLLDDEKPVFDQQKVALTEALYQRCMQQQRLSDEESDDEVLFKASQDLKKLLDPKGDARYAEIMALQYGRRKQLGKTFKFLLQMIEEKPTVMKYRELADLAAALGWDHVAEHFSEIIPVLFPTKYELF